MQAAEQHENEDLHVKTEPFQRQLRIALTDVEVAGRADRLAHLVVQVEQKEDDRKAANTAAKSQIEELSAELKRVSTEVRDKATYGTVQCERRHDYRMGKIVEVRTDTGVVLHERAMSFEEKQLELDGIKDPADDDENGGEPPESGDEPKAKKGRKKSKK